ncbi:hypothetical protein FF38_04718, partial [Lucilia cuprina]
SFFWLHWLTQLPGGVLAKKYGTKLVFGLSNVICCWMCFFIPMTANYSVTALIVLRTIQGAIAGLTWPAMHVLIAKWIPPDERSKFVTAYFGSSIGVAFAYPLFAYMMHYMSWKWVYLFCGIFGTLWWLLWLVLVYDSPAHHPRISISELRYIEKALGSSVQQKCKSVPTPWKEIFTSRPVWMNVIGQWASIWGLFTLMIQSPTYFKVIHNWDIRAIGILSGIPHILRMFFAYIFSLYADYLLRTNKMGQTNLRKFATAICTIIMGLVVLALAYLGRNPIWAIVLLSLATMLQGTASTGPMSSMIDIAPNYAGIIFGLCGTIACIPGFISAYIVGVLTLENQTFEAWTNVFLICAFMLIGCGVLYVLFADSSLQKWNDYSQYNAVKDIQLVEKNEERREDLDIKTRTILWHLVFWGFVINYMFCINLNLTIVDMVITNKVATSEFAPEKQLSLSEISKRSIEINSTTIETKFKHSSEKFHWNEYQQGLILGSFYWLHWLTQLPGGILAKKYGTKLVFGLSNVICCWMCFFIPMAAYNNFKILITLRIIQGAIAGLTWPAMHVLIAKWIPPNERSKFVTAYFGSSIGVALSYPIFAYIMHYMSWQWVYYICGIVGTLWWFGWLTLVYDSPEQHPRITKTELNYIEKALGCSVQQKTTHRIPIPWKDIFTSRTVWMNVMGQWAGVWGLFTLMTQSPTYFKVIHNWDIRATGILSGMPHILRMVFAYIFSLYADYLLKTNKMKRTTLRKFATFICAIVMGLVVLALAYLGRNPIYAVVLISLATMFQGAGSSGPLSSMIDIAPNYAGIICGICGTIGSLPGFISAYLVGVLTLDNQTFEAWTNVFLICAFMLIGCGVLYVLFADSSVQKWNDYSQYHVSKDLQLLEKNEMLKEKCCGT